MERVLDSMKTPEWWIGVVIVGLILSVLGGYIKQFIDKRISNASRRSLLRRKRKQEEHERFVKRLSGSREALLQANLNELKLYHLEGNTILWCLLVIVFSTYVSLPSGPAGHSKLTITLLVVFVYFGSRSLRRNSTEHFDAIIDALKEAPLKKTNSDESGYDEDTDPNG